MGRRAVAAMAAAALTSAAGWAGAEPSAARMALAAAPSAPGAPGPLVEAPAGTPPAQAAPAEDQGDDGWTSGKLWSLGGLTGLYTGVGVWAYFAWYHGKPRNQGWEWNGDGLFGKKTYAGGADKFGHFYSNHVITRLTTELLMSGGWRQVQASVIAGSLSAFYFGLVEAKDAYYYQFSVGDFSANLLGAGLGVAMINLPALDRLLDVRVDYWPTHEYREGFMDGDVNFVEDYSGQTYLLALHVAALPRVTDSRWTRWARYVDVVGGFQSVNYKPEPADEDAIPSQHLFLGAAVNLQAALEDLYGESAERGRARTSHRIGHYVLEFVSPPYTTLRMAEAERSLTDGRPPPQ
jgi:hypothetical protein